MPEELTIAGHKFIDGVCRTKVRRDNEDADCNRHLVDLMCVTPADIGKPHIACSGDLRDYEYNTIALYRDKSIQRIDDANKAAKGAL